LKSLARAADAFSRFEDELEDYLLSRDERFVRRMREARAAHLAGDTLPLDEITKELCIE
jgi:hypothetical protein